MSESSPASIELGGKLSVWVHLMRCMILERCGIAGNEAVACPAMLRMKNVPANIPIKAACCFSTSTISVPITAHLAWIRTIDQHLTQCIRSSCHSFVREVRMR